MWWRGHELPTASNGNLLKIGLNLVASGESVGAGLAASEYEWEHRPSPFRVRSAIVLVAATW